ncbi:MAG TPA: DUF6680 family protein [Polyangia bacterium]|nr:DUF6680 family protein [Polyangia bacterium]
MDLKAVAEILAVLIGPIAAVQAQRIVDEKKQKRERRLALFRTLMATRASRHRDSRYVEALNVIEVEFYDEEPVLESWRLLLQFLNAQVAVTDAWIGKYDDLVMGLLQEMATSLGYKRFPRDRLRDAYSPKIIQETETELLEIRGGIRALLAGKVSIPIHVNAPVPQQASSPTVALPAHPHAESLPPAKPALPPGTKL